MTGIEILFLETLKNAVVSFLAASLQGKLAILSGVVMALALAWNAFLIWRRKVEPALVSWIVWASLDIILAGSMWYSGLLNPQMAVAAVGAGVVMLLAFKFGKPGWSMTDLICLGGGLVAVIMWVLTKDPLSAMWISLTAVLIGCLPTYASIREAPEREDKAFWILVLTSSILAALGTEKMTVEALAQPVSFAIAQAYALWLLFKLRRPKIA